MSALGSRIAPGEVVAIYGRRGSGKTTKARQLLREVRRLVVFDPLGEWARLREAARCDSVQELRDRMAARWRRGFRLALVPARAYPETLHALAAFLWSAQAPYETGAAPPLVLAVDEMNLAYPSHRLSARLWGVQRLVLQGRHRGVAIVGISQRPSLVSSDFRGQAYRSIFFALSNPADRAAALELLGAERKGELAALRDHQFLEAGTGGRVSRGVNVFRAGRAANDNRPPAANDNRPPRARRP